MSHTRVNSENTRATNTELDHDQCHVDFGAHLSTFGRSVLTTKKQRTKTHTTKNAALSLLSLLSIGYAKLNCLLPPPLLLAASAGPPPLAVVVRCVRFGRPTHAAVGANRTQPLRVS